MSMPAAVGAAYPDPMFDLVPTTTPAMLTALAEALRGRTVAGITIHDAVAESVLGADDRPIVRLSLVLDDAARISTPGPTTRSARSTGWPGRRRSSSASRSSSTSSAKE